MSNNLTKTSLFIENFYDHEEMCKIMNEYGNNKYPFTGKNSEGDDVEVGVSKDCVVVTTYQSNGWIRKNYHHRDGDMEEIFEGRWDR